MMLSELKLKVGKSITRRLCITPKFVILILRHGGAGEESQYRLLYRISRYFGRLTLLLLRFGGLADWRTQYDKFRFCKGLA